MSDAREAKIATSDYDSSTAQRTSVTAARAAGGRVCVVFKVYRSFYSTTSVHPVSVLILHPTETKIMWSQTVRQRKTKTTAINRGKASEMLAYLVREHNKTSQTRKI